MAPLVAAQGEQRLWSLQWRWPVRPVQRRRTACWKLLAKRALKIWQVMNLVCCWMRGSMPPASLRATLRDGVASRTGKCTMSMTIAPPRTIAVLAGKLLAGAGGHAKHRLHA